MFKVSVNKLIASNGITWVVTVDHPLRPKDAMPWDEGRMEVFHTSIEDHANQTKDDWDKFFNYNSKGDLNEL